MISRRSRAGRTWESGPVTASQATFIWGRAEILERPLRVKVRTSELAAKVLRGGESNVGASGIVRMDEEDSACARGDGAFEGLEIEEPAVGVGEGIGDEADVLQAG